MPKTFKTDAAKAWVAAELGDDFDYDSVTPEELEDITERIRAIDERAEAEDLQSSEE